jgi:hypothetical protein
MVSGSTRPSVAWGAAIQLACDEPLVGTSGRALTAVAGTVDSSPSPARGDVSSTVAHLSGGCSNTCDDILRICGRKLRPRALTLELLP